MAALAEHLQLACAVQPISHLRSHASKRFRNTCDSTCAAVASAGGSHLPFKFLHTMCLGQPQYSFGSLRSTDFAYLGPGGGYAFALPSRCHPSPPGDQSRPRRWWRPSKRYRCSPQREKWDRHCRIVRAQQGLRRNHPRLRRSCKIASSLGRGPNLPGSRRHSNPHHSWRRRQKPFPWQPGQSPQPATMDWPSPSYTGSSQEGNRKYCRVASCTASKVPHPPFHHPLCLAIPSSSLRPSNLLLSEPSWPKWQTPNHAPNHDTPWSRWRRWRIQSHSWIGCWRNKGRSKKQAPVDLVALPWIPWMPLLCDLHLPSLDLFAVRWWAAKLHAFRSDTGSHRSLSGWWFERKLFPLSCSSS